MGEKDKVEDAKAKAEAEEVITAVYKLYLHCSQCAQAIEKPIIRTSGVQNVDTDVEEGIVKVKGIFDVKKIHELLEKKSKRKVELISPKPKEKEDKPKEKEEKPEKKEVVAKTTVIKLHIHCEKCEEDLKLKLLKLRGVYSVKMNGEAETCTVVGIIEEKKLLEYIRKKTGKYGEIVPQKEEKKKEEEKKKDGGKDKEKEPKVSKEVKSDQVEKIEVVDQKIKEDLKPKDVVVPYFIHCTHAPQWFSDENPNACSVM